MPGLHATPSGAEAVFCAPSAERVEVCLFSPEGEDRHSLRRDDAGYHRGHIPAGPGQHYGLRTHGPWDPARGLWHDPGLLLVDPYARALSGEFVDHPTVHHDRSGGDSAPWVPRSVLVEAPDPPRPGPAVPWPDTVIYETHIRNLTMLHPDVDPTLRGTYLGAASPPVIEHLLGMGITSVELMPVAHHVTEPFLQARGLRNRWGYSTLAWFAPHGGYASGDDGRQVAEFAQMVDLYHAAGLEVIVDVVFNHTAEGDLTGPILSFKGLHNPGWYRISPGGGYVDWTGTGNTLATHDLRVRDTIRLALRWWAEGLGVDGFRFDLAATLGRGAEDFDPDHLSWITDDPVLSDRKMIAEPWDLGPRGYRLGHFGGRWREWNGLFRDDVRDFWRGRGEGAAFALRMGGSLDVFGHNAPEASVNLVTSHDGFTLADLVAYDHKHNHDNGEGNRDGHDDNRSWNSGEEGPSEDPDVLEVRRRRAAALLSTTLLAAGVPMLTGGDELGCSHGGNNNAYTLDEVSWYIWDDPVLAGTVARLTALRRLHPPLRSGTARLVPDSPACVVEMAEGDRRLLVVANPGGDASVAHLPPGTWGVAFDSADEAIADPADGRMDVAPWTVRVLVPRGRGPS
ncbi:MAG: glycogen debranching protein [Actinomycetota bacterium]